VSLNATLVVQKIPTGTVYSPPVSLPMSHTAPPAAPKRI
jgi:hypothetical protein